MKPKKNNPKSNPIKRSMLQPTITVDEIRHLISRARNECDRQWQHREGLEATGELLAKLPEFLNGLVTITTR